MEKAMRQVTNLTQILEDHRLWASGEGGKRADLRDVDLSYANLRDADLSYADLRGDNLRYADLRGANLLGVDLRNADLLGVDLRGANLAKADLRYADLHDADLRGVDLIVLQLPIWVAYVHRETVQISCQHHSHDDWRQFTDEEIDQMDPKALPWWRAHKSIIFAAMDTVTGNSTP